MTVIAAYVDSPIGFLLADTLLTTQGVPLRSGELTLPINSRKVPAIDSLSTDRKLFVADYASKVTIINDRLAVAFAGNYEHAIEFVDKLKYDLRNFDGSPNSLGSAVDNILESMTMSTPPVISPEVPK